MIDFLVYNIIEILHFQLEIWTFEFTTDTILLAFDIGGATVRSTKLKQKPCASEYRDSTIQFTIILYEGGLLCVGSRFV